MSVNGIIQKFRLSGMSQIIPILAVMMDVFWIYTWLVWISRIQALHWKGTPLNLVSCLLLGILVEAGVRSALTRDWSLNKVRWAAIPLSLLFLFILIRLNLGGGYALWKMDWFSWVASQTSELVSVCLFGVIIIGRGITAGQQDNSFSVLYRRFVFGLVGIIVVLTIWRLGSSQITSIWQSLGLEILLFFACGLLALAISNLERLRLELMQHQEATASFSRRWISMLIILVVTVLAAGILFTSLLSPSTGASIVHFLGNLGHWLLTGLTYLLYPLGFVVQVLLWIAKYILALIRKEPPPQNPEGNLGDVSKMFPDTGDGSVPHALILVLKWGSILIASGLVVFFLSRMLSRYWKVKTEEGVEEVNETLGTWNLLKMDLRGFLAWLWRRLRRGKKVQPEEINFFVPPAVEPEDDKQYTIREIYQALLWEGRQNGIARQTTETPYEYNRRLQKERQNMADDLNSITEAYVVERYAQINPVPEKISWLNRVWRNVRQKFENKESEL